MSVNTVSPLTADTVPSTIEPDLNVDSLPVPARSSAMAADFSLASAGLRIAIFYTFLVCSQSRFSAALFPSLGKRIRKVSKNNGERKQNFRFCLRRLAIPWRHRLRILPPAPVDTACVIAIPAHPLVHPLHGAVSRAINDGLSILPGAELDHRTLGRHRNRENRRRNHQC